MVAPLRLSDHVHLRRFQQKFAHLLFLEGAAAVSEEAKAAKRGFLALWQNKGATDIGSVFFY